MEEPLPNRKATVPVPDYVMINFVHWVETYHPEIQSLQHYPEGTLLSLVREFEGERPDIPPSPPPEWIRGFEELKKQHSEREGYQSLIKRRIK